MEKQIIGYVDDNKFIILIYKIDGKYYTSDIGVYLLTEDNKSKLLSLFGTKMTIKEASDLLDNNFK